MQCRQIRFNGRYSMLDFGVYIGSEVDTDTRREKAKPRIIRETIPFMNGSYDFSKLSGKTIYDDRKLYYTLIISETTKELVAEKADKIDEWLSSDADELYDSEYPGWKFVGVIYEGMSEIQYYSYNETKGKVTVEFTASPYLRSRSGQETNCCDITPDASPAYYLFNEYTSGGVEYYYLSRMKRASSSAPLSGSTITYDETILPGPRAGAYPHITIAAATAPAYYMMPPKSTNDTSIGVDESTLTGGSIVSGGIEGYTYLKQNAGEALSFRIYGYDPTTLGDSTSRSNCTMQIKSAAWYYPANSGTVRFRKDLIPNTDRMQILSEGDPVVRINPPRTGTIDPIDINNFALNLYDFIGIENAENELCKLRYNSVTYRR